MAKACPVCGTELTAGIRPWHLVCDKCGYEGSNLEPHIVPNASTSGIDEVARERALSALRHRNFAQIVAQISGLMPGVGIRARPRLLDVGCAHGWFMQACSAQFDVVGIEPDNAVAEAARKRVGPIRDGFFPDALQADEQFDAIVFNDVMEHIPDVRYVMSACRDHLRVGGLLVINAPCRYGFIYRVAKLTARCGYAGAFERMWQLGLPSPHVHYFDPESIHRLGTSVGFEVVKQASLPSVVASGLYSRILYSRQIARPVAVVIAAITLLAMPVLRFLPADITVWYLQKNAASRVPVSFGHAN